VESDPSGAGTGTTGTAVGATPGSGSLSATGTTMPAQKT
jgi:hypothetical protein